jgi:hypothetical protein
MNIQQACDILANANNHQQHLKYFKDLYTHLGSTSSSDLKALFDFVGNDTLKWLQSLPPNARSKDTCRKYKTPVYILLDDASVQQAFGQDYCVKVQRNVKNCFQKHIVEVVASRNKHEVAKPEEVAPVGEDIKDTIYDSSDEDDGNLDISQLEPICDDKTVEDSAVDYKQLYEDLLFKHNFMVEQLKRENEKLWEVMGKFASK